MRAEFREAYDRLNREKQLNGLLFGLLVGLAFSIGVWGLDALLLNRANATYSWLKFVIGLPILLVMGCFVGWITTKVDNSLVSLFFWLGFSVVGIYIASHMPYEPFSYLMGLINPDYQAFDLYPFANSVRIRMGILYLVTGGLTVFAGIFGMFIVEAATRASSKTSRWFTLMVSFLMFVPIGLVTDSLINAPLRDPVIGVHNLIQNGLKAEVSPVSEQEARQLGLRALRPFGNLIHTPYQLNLSYYDPESLSETSVHVKFLTDTGPVWGNCFVLNGYPSFCQLSTDLYLGRLNCLMQGGQERKCRMLVNSQSPQVLEDLLAQTGENPQMSIHDQFGSLVLVNLFSSEHETIQCSLLVTGDIKLNECHPMKAGEPNSYAASSSLTSDQPPSASQVQNKNQQPLLKEAQIDALDGTKLSAYVIDVSVDLESLVYSGEARVDYVNNEGIPLDSLFFRLLPNGGGCFGKGSLAVTQVKVGGVDTPTSLSGQDTVLEVDLPKSVAAGQEISLNLSFEGRIPRDFSANGELSGYGIFNYSEQVLSLAAWYPMLAVYDEHGWNVQPPSRIGDSIFSDIANYSISITLPENIHVVATGVEEEKELLPGSQKLFYTSGPARDFFIVASPNFEKISQRVDGTYVNVFYLPGHSESARQALSVSSESLKVFDLKFGAYPYTELDVVEAPMQYALGVEFPGIVLVSSQLFNTPEKPEFAVTIAHEVAHQWWYNVVGNDVFQDPWLDEGLATYSSSLFFEFGPYKTVPGAMFQLWQDKVENLVETGQDQIVSLPLAFFEGLGNPGIYGDVVYKKAALFYVELRKEIGDEAFFSALQNYYRNQQFQIAGGDDLLLEFEVAAGRLLDDIYQAWLFSKQE